MSHHADHQSFEGSIRFRHLGLRRHPWSDLYHGLLETSWRSFILGMAVAFVVVNVVFALLYMAGGDCIGTGDTLTLREAFSFSIQTISTIGYGSLSPTTVYADALVAVESFTGLLGVALWSGLCFAKFSRPVARVSFSEQAVICVEEGRATFMVRLANERTSSIVDARAHAYAMIARTTMEGNTVQRFVPLGLVHKHTPVFLMSWQVMHVCEGESALLPLIQGTPGDEVTGVVVSVVGTEDTFKQSVHAQHLYRPEDIMVGYRFEDIIDHEDGVIVVNHSKLSVIKRDPCWIATAVGPLGVSESEPPKEAVSDSVVPARVCARCIDGGAEQS